MKGFRGVAGIIGSRTLYSFVQLDPLAIRTSSTAAVVPKMVLADPPSPAAEPAGRPFQRPTWPLAERADLPSIAQVRRDHRIVGLDHDRSIPRVVRSVILM